MLMQFVTGRLEGKIEPRELNLAALCLVKYPEMNWNDLTMVQQVDLIRHALTADLVFLIDPTSQYMKYWDSLILILLLYTSLVTPYEVAFLETHIDGLFVVNRFVDLCFIKDMVLQLYLKVEHRSRRGTVMLKDRSLIRQQYFRGWFIIDFISIIPYDMAGYVFSSTAVQQLKTLRMVRCLRLLKLARIFKASRLIRRWQNRISISFASFALGRFLVGIVLASHWMACLWGIVGGALGEPVCKLGPDSSIPVAVDYTGLSWITSMYPEHFDNPCDHTRLYAASLHWSVMTITSIGYGDICPTRFEEYVTCAICMLGGSVGWAYIIGAACAVIMSMDPVRIQFEQSMDALNAMMSEQQVPHILKERLRENMRESQHLQRLLRSRQLSRDMSTSLRGELMMHSAQEWVSRLGFLRKCSRKFIMDLIDDFDVTLFSRRETIADVGRLCIVDRGAVGRAGQVLVPFSVWGEDMICQQRLHKHTVATALTYVQALLLTRSTLDRILEDYPEERSSIRKFAGWFALRRAVFMVNAEARKGRRSSTLADLHNCFEEVTEMRRKNSKEANKSGANTNGPSVKHKADRVGGAATATQGLSEPSCTSTLPDVSPEELKKILDQRYTALEERLLGRVKRLVDERLTWLKTSDAAYNAPTRPILSPLGTASGASPSAVQEVSGCGGCYKG